MTQRRALQLDKAQAEYFELGECSSDISSVLASKICVTLFVIILIVFVLQAIAWWRLSNRPVPLILAILAFSLLIVSMLF